MIEFDYPWMFVFLLLPVAVRLLLPHHMEERSSLQAPFFERLVNITGQTPTKGAVRLQRNLTQRLLLGLGWALLVTALAKPEWVGEPITQNKTARDLMIAVDLSGSMETADFVDDNGTAQTRLDGVKSILADFAKNRDGDRLGLILFGSAPYLQVPFTADLDVFVELLDESAVGMAGARTNFGDAIGLAIKLFEKSKVKDRVLIVLTDGNDTGSKVPPIEAAKIARAHNIKIHTIAVGVAKGDEQTALDVETLQMVAKVNGGQFFQAANQLDLVKAHEEIARLEPRKYETLVYSPKSSLFQYPLGVVALLYMIFHGILNLKAFVRNGDRS
ncbi:MAG: Ca-activated chloride channel family protein [Gammaproteobacteria bacterium]|jgi:Ca-activated chloride channel family protein